MTKTWIYTIFLMILGFFYHWLLIRVGNTIFCVSGRLSSIEYEGGIKYLDEVLGMDPAPDLHVTAQLTNEASAFIEEP